MVNKDQRNVTVTVLTCRFITTLLQYYECKYSPKRLMYEEMLKVIPDM